MTTTTTIDGRSVELFEPPSERRSFSPGDVLRLLVGLAITGLGALIASSAQSTIAGLEEDLLRAFARLPNQAESAVLSLAQLVTSIVPAAVFVVLLFQRKVKLALLLLATGALATLAMATADAIFLDDDLSSIIDSIISEQDRSNETLVDPSFPDSRALASTTAVVTVAAPFLSRRWKRALRWAIGVLVLLRLVAVSEPAFDFVLALGIGVAVGSAILLVFGSPQQEPRPLELLRALRAIGLRPTRILRPDDQRGTALRYDVSDEDGSTYTVTLRTPAERDSDLLTRTYRRFRFRSSEVGNEYASVKRRIEHEALLRTLATKAGVRTFDVDRIGVTTRGSAFLVSTTEAARLARPDDLSTPGVLTDAWAQLAALHDAGIAHRALTTEALRITAGGTVLLADFDSAQTAPTAREQARDVAELLTETALVVGAGAAVDAAVGAMGPDRVAPAIRMLQPLALPGETRARVAETDGLLDELRAEVHRVTGEPGLELEDLERIKPRTILIIGASTLAFYSLLPQLANLEDTIDAFGNAEFGWIGVALLASVVTYLFAAVSFQGAVAETIPFAANVRAQVSSSFAGLVGPAGVGGFALTARFLERVGVGAAESGASVAVNAIAGFVVHVSLMLGFFWWAGSADLGGFSLPDSSTVLLVLSVALLALGLATLVGPVRRKIMAPLFTSLRTALGQVGQVFQNPARVLALFGGSAGITATYLVGIAASVEAFGGGLTLAQIGAAYLGAVTIATVSPTPGGLGALESAMIAGFTGFGLDAGIAVSATLTFRLATFWLPILPGWLALGWMQRNGEL